MSNLRLITETTFDIVQQIAEATEPGAKKQFFIEGVFLQSEKKNKNGRVYPKQTMDREVQRYIREHVERGNAFGELGHPAGPTINPDRISHRIVSLREDGNDYIGKAIINNNPMGMIARGLMEDGGQLAVSSRGIGSLKSVGGAMQVQEDFFLSTAADIVINPSAPDAFVNGIMEGREYFWEGDSLRERNMEQIRRDLDKARLTEEQVLAAWTKMARLVTKG